MMKRAQEDSSACPYTCLDRSSDRITESMRFAVYFGPSVMTFSFE